MRRQHEYAYGDVLFHVRPLSFVIRIRYSSIILPWCRARHYCVALFQIMPAFSLKNKRRALQIATALAFVLIPILNRNRYSLVYGNFLSFHMFGIPLADPLAVLQLTVKNYYLTVENVIGTLIALTVAFLLGTVFCSWVCPYVLLYESTHQ